MATKKQKIPATVRNSIWNYYIGSDVKIGPCFCCNNETISTANFECGHVQSEKEGGDLTLTNLRPICSLCNKSMSTNNMEVFMDKYGYKKNDCWNGLETKISKINSTKTSKKEIYDVLNIKELKLIGKELNIKETTKLKIIENLLSCGFEYDDWFSKYIDKLTNDKLKIICKCLKLSIKKNKIKTQEMLKSNNVQIYVMDELINENKTKKIFIECNGDETKNCIHCIPCKDGIMIQCDKCNNSHSYFTNELDDISFIELRSEYYASNKICKKCDKETTQYIYNNSFFKFDEKYPKLNFNSDEEKELKIKCGLNKKNNDDIIKKEKTNIYTEDYTGNEYLEKLKKENIELKIKLYSLNVMLKYSEIKTIENIYILEFDDPKNKCFGEKTFKFLLAGSKLYNYINKMKLILRHNNFNHHDIMNLHVEVLNDDTESDDIFLERVKMLECKSINVINPTNYKIEENDIILLLGELDGYLKNTKIIIGTFGNDIVSNAYLCLLNNL